jgi:mannose-6-phosphate isomerase
MLPPLDHPLRFEPFLRPMIWGGRKIARLLGKNLPAPGPYGESWEVSDHPVHRSRLATASGFHVSLRHLMQEQPHALLGPAADHYSTFPWLIKLLDAHDWLSVQVHPDEEAVQRLLPGELAKTEAWLVLDAEPTSRIYAGLLPGVGPTELRQAVTCGAVQECLHSFTPTAGDFVFLPAGTVHAVGGGVFLAEIQQTSDATFRLFDWNRVDTHGKPRPLHVEEAFASMHWDAGPVAPLKPKLQDERSASCGSPMMTCRYFDVDYVQWTGSATVGAAGRLQALIATAGCGRFANGEFLMPGDVWIFPAAMPSMALELETPLTGLLCSLPLVA